MRNVRIPMPDGVTLAADLYMPVCEDNRHFPAIIEYTPYHKNNNPVYGPRASRYPYFASHGYVFVNVDIRGTGDSGGANTAPTSPEEVRDGLALIEWCTQQSWSDGTVGMIGISYTAGVCYDAARQAPEALKAIVVCQMCSDWYDGMACPGGTPRPFAYENYAPLMAAYNFAPPNPDLVGSEWAELWQQRMEGSEPWSLAYLRNLLDGPYWQERLLRGQEDQVRAATFLIGGWCDWYPDDLLKVYSRLQCPKRVLIGPWTHNYPENGWPLPRINDRFECLRWFDRHLKGIDTDPERPVEAEPEVTLYVREFTPPALLRRDDPGYFISLNRWGPEDQKQAILTLSEGKRLVPGPGNLWPRAALPGRTELPYKVDVGHASGRYVIGQFLPGWGMPDDQRLDEPFCAVFDLDPDIHLDELELVGTPEARLYLSCTASTALISAKLCDVAPDGTSVLITKGVLNLTHRNGHTYPEPLAPGQVYEVRFSLLATAYRLRRGHRLRLMLAPADFQNAWPTPEPHSLTIHHSPEYQSTLCLPFRAVEDRDGARPDYPSFRPSDFPPLPADQLPTPEYEIRRDLVRQKVEVCYTTQSGAGKNRSRYTVNLLRPADASVDSEFEYPLQWSGTDVLVRSHCLTRSDETAFHHTTEVEVSINGRPHWSKSWRLSVPRRGC